MSEDFDLVKIQQRLDELRIEQDRLISLLCRRKAFIEGQIQSLNEVLKIMDENKEDKP